MINSLSKPFKYYFRAPKTPFPGFPAFFHKNPSIIYNFRNFFIPWVKKKIGHPFTNRSFKEMSPKKGQLPQNFEKPSIFIQTPSLHSISKLPNPLYTSKPTP